jgi:DNA-binding response OmpR family regulator
MTGSETSVATNREHNGDVRLLLIEDEPMTARMLAKGLREQAYAVDVAGSARRALELVNEIDYELIVLDLGLPDADGVTLCRRLRENRTTAAAAILILTARSGVPSRIAGLDSGADDYLTKPFDFGELLARIRALARRARGLHSRSAWSLATWLSIPPLARHSAVALGCR